jgi:hypothetical protein
MRSALLGLLLIAPALSAQEATQGLDVRVSGRVLTNGFYNQGFTNNSDVPTFVLQTPGSADESKGSVGGIIRQTMLRVTAGMAGVAGGDLHAEVETDFFGGQMPSGGGRTHPLLRVRRAFFELRWTRWALLIGQEAPPIAEINPSSLASVGFPGFAAAGNLWLWLPQVRVTSHLARGSRIRFDLEGAVLAPSSAEAQGTFLTQPDQAEFSARPNFEGRLVARWGDDDHAGEIGVGGHLGWLLVGTDSLRTSKGVVAALRVPLGRWLEVRSEVFYGRALAGLGGGGIGQNVRIDGETVETTGGWAQLLIHGSRWEAGAGLGVDDPQEGGLDPLTRRQMNTVLTAHVLWRPAPLVFGLEFRHLATTYGSGPQGGEREASHLNLAAGIEF